MNSTKRLLAVLLALTMVFGMAACGSSDSGAKQESPAPASVEPAVENTEAPETAEPAEEAAGTRVVTDMLGREVKIPAKVKTIVPIEDVPIMVCYLGITDMIVGIEDCEITENPIRIYAVSHTEEWSALPVVGTSAGEFAFYPEQLIEADPDVIITSTSAEIADDIQRQTAIPVVCVPSSMKPFTQEYADSLLFIADVCGCEERGRELVDYINNNLADLAERVSGLDDSQKPKVLGGAATFRGGHSIDGVYKIYPAFNALGINNVAKDIEAKSTALVDKEMILEWDPDIIFLDASNVHLVRDDYAENPDFFAQLQAFQNGKIYQMPNYNSHVYNVDVSLLNAYYIGSLVYPELFADVDLEAKAAEIFDMFDGMPDYLNVLTEAGYGYGQVNLGE
ncbi:MAG: ABC transporter substrate-binding protein [Oscillospiraceae bacterium]|nr:ABC transporter substrate-binding protein [Oscillospiraceae bacterium]